MRLRDVEEEARRLIIESEATPGPKLPIRQWLMERMKSAYIRAKFSTAIRAAEEDREP